MRSGSLSWRAALAALGFVIVATTSAPARAEGPLPPPVGGEASPEVPSKEALPTHWPHRTFERRSPGLMSTAIILAAVAMTTVGAGGAVYGEAKDSCIDQHRPNGSASGHFCFADRTQFDVGMGMMVAGGAVFALSVPLAVWAGSGTPRDVTPRETAPRAALSLGPTGAFVTGSF